MFNQKYGHEKRDFLYCPVVCIRLAVGFANRSLCAGQQSIFEMQ